MATTRSLPTDDWPTATTRLQRETESSCTAFFVPMDSLPKSELHKLQMAGFISQDNQVRLLRDKHIPYLIRGLEYLPPGYASMDASRPWFMYWILHSLELLDDEEDIQKFADSCMNTIKRCWSGSFGGGFGGGIIQLGHMATTYASCLALAIIGTPEAYDLVDRKGLNDFFLSLKDPATGAFHAHDQGELDVRTTYCAISIASLYGILTPELTAGVVDFVRACQTYEGGFGPFPHQEAHGGYCFCAAAILDILNAWDAVDVDALLHYTAHRQMAVEGGYQGRTNKLVDGCYSFWQGSVPALLAKANKSGGSYVSDAEAHQRYILLCGQQIEGGLRDKPGKPRDHYHSCYVLSGLSLSQWNGNTLVGDNQNLLIETHPVYNIALDKVGRIQAYFAAKDKK
ncbi:unnamed protein product [Aphanomyces euteiches]